MHTFPISDSFALINNDFKINSNTIDFLKSNYQDVESVKQIQSNIALLVEKESSKTRTFFIKKCYIITTAIATSLILTKIIAFGLLWTKSMTPHFTSSYTFYASIVATGLLSIVFHILNENNHRSALKTISSDALTKHGNETTKLKDWCRQVSQTKTELNRLLKNCEDELKNSQDEVIKEQLKINSHGLSKMIQEVNRTTDYIKRSNTLKLYVLRDIELSNI